MSLTNLINDNLKFAISQISVTLTTKIQILGSAQFGNLSSDGTTVTIPDLTGLDTSATHVRVSGAFDSEYNGTFAIQSISSTSVSYLATGPVRNTFGCQVEVGIIFSYSANKQDVDSSFEIFEDGREAIVDTKFYIAKSEYSTLPSKGEILNDGTSNFKVVSIQDDAVGVARRLDCASEFQR